MEAHISRLHGAAGELRAAAARLAALAVHPPVHPSLAADEVSASAASRLSASGVVLASRASDAASVLASAAAAIHLTAASLQAMNLGNVSVVSLHGNHAPVAAGVPTPAVTANMPTVRVPIAPPVPRPGEVASAIMHAGNPASGAGFTAATANYANTFRATATAARTVAAAVTASLTGHAGPRISAALDRFGRWSDDMADNATAVGQFAEQHRERFTQTQQQTPQPHEFEDKRRELAIAAQSRNGALVAKAQSDIAALTNRVSVAATSYQLRELPAAPPPPPPVVHVVEPSPPQPNSADSDGEDTPSPHHPGAGGDGSGDDTLDATVDGTDRGIGDPAAAGVGGGGVDPMAQGLPVIAASLPSMLAGAVGGVVGMAASIPEQIAQQAQAAAGAALQTVSSLGSALAQPSSTDLTSPTDALGDIGESGGGLGDTGGGGGEGGDVGGTDPASAGGDLSTGGMAGMGAPTGSGPALTGYTGPPATPAGAGLSAGAPPMGMMPMGGMGAMGGMGGASSGTRAVKDPDREIYLPPRPNSEPMKTTTRTVTAVDEPTATPKPAMPQAPVSSGRERRDIVVRPKGGGGS